MKTFKIDRKYKQRYAIGFLLVYIAFLGFYTIVKKDYSATLEHAIMWGLLYILAYYIYIHRMKIEMPDADLLVCKPPQNLSHKKVATRDIEKVVVKKKSPFASVTLFFKNQAITLHPEDSDAFIDVLKAPNTQALITVE